MVHMLVAILSWVATGFSFFCYFLIAKKVRFGFIAWLTSNIIWIAVNFLGVPNPAQIVMFTAYIGTNFYGLASWRKETCRDDCHMVTLIPR